MVVVQLITGGGRAFGLSTLLGKVLLLLGRRRLIPYESDLWWMIPVAAAVGLIGVFYFCFNKFWVVGKYFKDTDRAKQRMRL